MWRTARIVHIDMVDRDDIGTGPVSSVSFYTGFVLSIAEIDFMVEEGKLTFFPR